MLLIVTAVEEGRHVELECFDSWWVGQCSYWRAEVRLHLRGLGRKRLGAGQGKKDDKGSEK
jgi:hypothetical protein